MKMYWVAIEDAYTYEVSEFEKATEKKVLYLLDGYKADLSNPTKFSEHEGKHIVYEGVTYKGGFGYNIWVASKYIKL